MRREQYRSGPREYRELVHAGFQLNGLDGRNDAARILDRAFEPVRDYFSLRVDAGHRRDKPFDEWIEGWARVIYEFDGYSVRRFLKEKAGLSDEEMELVDTLEHVTSSQPSFVRTFAGRSLLHSGTGFWEITGGLDRLPQKLYAELEGEVRLNERMTHLEVRRESGRPRVTIRTVHDNESEHGERGGSKVHHGDAAILALPFSCLRQVTVDPPFSYKKRRAVMDLCYDAATKVFLEFSRRWWELDEEQWISELETLRPGLYERCRELEEHPEADDVFLLDTARGASARLLDFYRSYRPLPHEALERRASGFAGGGSVTDGPNRFVYYPSHPADGCEGGVVLASYVWADDARRWDSMAEDERYAFALRQLERMHGKRITVFFTGRGATASWGRNRYALGEAAAFQPGQLTQLYPDIPTPEGPVYFAGEHVSLKHAWIEGAIETAVQAAIDVHEREC